METYLVGGAVRDQLLGRPVRERDWVVIGATPEEMELLGFRVKNRGFPVYLHPETGEEYALARRESKSGFGYKGFEFDFTTSITLEEDLARRDLTINAMAQAESGEIIDPFRGRIDLQSRCLRHVSSAFVEDPLRVLRLARFQAELSDFRFTINEQTGSLALQMCASGELRTLTSGRIWQETARALNSSTPAAYFLTLLHWGALSQLMPWLHSEYESDFKDSIDALSRASRQCVDLNVRLAALLVSLTLNRRTPVAPPENWPIPAAARVLTQLCLDHPVPNTADAHTILNWLERVDAWRRSDRFSSIVRVWLAVRPDSSASLSRLRQCRDMSMHAPAPDPGINPREAVRAYRLQRIVRSLQRSRL